MLTINEYFRNCKAHVFNFCAFDILIRKNLVEADKTVKEIVVLVFLVIFSKNKRSSEGWISSIHGNAGNLPLNMGDDFSNRFFNNLCFAFKLCG